MPNLDVKLSIPLALLVGSLVFSYFTQVAWWAITGLTLFIGAMFMDNKKHDELFFNIFMIIALIFFILGIVSMKWTYAIFPK